MRHVWLAVAAISTGFGIWATHFIAMLAFSPGIPSGYNIGLTLLSLVAAIVLTGVGLGGCAARALPPAALARRRHRRRRHRRHALHRHGRVRNRRRRSSGIPTLVDGIDRGSAPRSAPPRCRSVCTSAATAEVRSRRRRAADAGDRQPSLHGDGRGLDHSRSDHRDFAESALPAAGWRSPSRWRASPSSLLALAARRARRARPPAHPSSKWTGCAVSPTRRSKG